MEEEMSRGKGWEGEDWALFLYVLEGWVAVRMPRGGVWCYVRTGNLEDLGVQL